MPRSGMLNKLRTRAGGFFFYFCFFILSGV